MISAYVSCVACSGEFSPSKIDLPNEIVEVCSVCGGHHYTVDVDTYDKITRELRLVDLVEGEAQSYFDVSIYDGSGRFHGWRRSGSAFDHVVQLG